MQVLPTQKLFGLPALDLRAFVRQYETFTYRDFAGYFGLSARDAKALLLEMAAQHYVTVPTKAKGRYELDTEGFRLVHALAVNKISRQKAEDLLSALFDRVALVAEDDNFIFEVDELWVFGSYVKSATQLSDVDLWATYRYKQRLGPYEREMERILNTAEAAGKDVTFWNAPQRYGIEKTARFLKNRRRHLSFMSARSRHLDGAKDAVCLYQALPE